MYDSPTRWHYCARTSQANRSRVRTAAATITGDALDGQASRSQVEAGQAGCCRREVRDRDRRPRQDSSGRVSFRGEAQGGSQDPQATPAGRAAAGRRGPNRSEAAAQAGEGALAPAAPGGHSRRRSRRRLRPFRSKRPRLPSRRRSRRPHLARRARRSPPRPAQRLRPTQSPPRLPRIPKRRPPRRAARQGRRRRPGDLRRPACRGLLPAREEARPDGGPETGGNGQRRAALSGTCPSCGAALYKLVSRTAR